MHFSSCLLLLLGLGAYQAEAGVPGFVDMPVPVQPSRQRPSDAETKRSRAVGRFTEQLEILQPRLDPALTRYTKVSTTLAGNYTFGSSDVLVTLASRWIDAFMAMYPNVTMQLEAPYAGSLGALELIKGKLQGVFVSRELKPSDISSFKAEYGYDAFSLPISQGSYRHFGSLDTMAFVVNKENPLTTLSFTELDSIFSTTRHRGGKAVTKWGDLGVEGKLKNETIQVYGLEPWNGIEEFTRLRVLNYNGKRGEWRDGNHTNPNKDENVHWDETIFNATKHVYDDAAGIAYTGLAYMDYPCKVLATYNNTGDTPVSPTYENVVKGLWPLTRLTYFNTNRDPKNGTDPVLRELSRFVLSQQGQSILLDHGVFLPFNPAQQKASLDMVAN